MSTSITISKQIAIKDEGVIKTSDVNSIDFTGAGVTATNVGNAVTVNVPGGGGGEVTGLQSVVYSSLFGFKTSNTLSAINTINHATHTGMQYTPYIPNTTFTCVEFSINVGIAQATGLARICVYSSSNNAPTNLLYSSADLSCSTTGTKSVISSFIFTKGTTYWLGLQANLSTINIAGLSSYACIPSASFFNGSAITCWIEIGLTYASGAPSVAGVNSYIFNTSPQIIMKK
jgi:hypothetical protein